MNTMSKKTLVPFAFALLLALALLPSVGAQSRLKDIAVVQGVRGNQLYGVGLVIGLSGTGDGTNVPFTPQAVAAMLQKMGITVPTGSLQLKNVAFVGITATLPPFVHSGNTIDVTVSSMGDAKSLQGGTLLQTPLQAPNGLVCASAQGPISVGGFLASGGSGGSVTQNHVTAGRIPGGAIVEANVPTTLIGAAANSLSITLNSPDYTTAERIAKAIRRQMPLGATNIRPVDAGTVQVDFLPGTDTVGLIASLEDVEIDTDNVAKIVINERTGTVVMGGDVVVTPCAVANGNLTVSISNDPVISQPSPLSSGTTTVQPHKDIKVSEGGGHVMPIPDSPTLDKVVRSLNALGVTPRDLIAILQAMQDAGALHAEIEVQ
jgi:flagellar P-ring protein precursor FlgI